MHRTQIYLDEEQTARLDEHAARESTTRSTVIRRAVDEYLTREDGDPGAWTAHWREAVSATAGIAPYLADGAGYVERRRAADTERLRELDS